MENVETFLQSAYSSIVTMTYLHPVLPLLGTRDRESGSFCLLYLCQMVLLQICTMEESSKGRTSWDPEGMVPYYVDGRLWVGFDNVRSLLEKVRVLNTNWGYRENQQIN